MDRAEIKKYLKSKGFGSTSIEYILDAISEREAIENAKNSEEVKRSKDIMKFKPKPGKATLNQIGETQTYLGGDDRGLPIYQEDVDMIKKSQPLAKKLVEVQNEKQTLRTLKDIIDEVRNVKPEELNVGPDTTENIQEIDDNYQVPGEMRGVPIYDSGDVMFGVDLETQGLRGNTEVMFRREEDLVDLQHNTRGMETIDDKMYPSKKDVGKAMEECNKNVSDPGDYYRYGNILKRMDETNTRKNNDYGDAAYQGYKKYGPAYFLVQLHNKLSRLESLTINNRSQMVKDESIDDTLLDMANYAIMFLESRHRND